MAGSRSSMEALSGRGVPCRLREEALGVLRPDWKGCWVGRGVLRPDLGGEAGRGVLRADWSGEGDDDGGVGVLRTEWSGEAGAVVVSPARDKISPARDRDTSSSFTSNPKLS